MQLGRGGGGVNVVLRFAFAGFEFGLAAVRGFDGVGAGLDLGLLGKETPTGVTVFGTLAVFVLFDGSLGAVLAADDLDHSSGFVGADIVADDGVGKAGLVARRQKGPPCGVIDSGFRKKYWPEDCPML